jgi:hypothetical protein
MYTKFLNYMLIIIIYEEIKFLDPHFKLTLSQF